MEVGEYTVDDKLDKFERSCRCADVPGVEDYISFKGYLGSVGIFLVGPIFSYIFGVRDLITVVVGNIFVSDNSERISSLNALLFGSFRALTYALVYVSPFIGL